MKSRETLIRLKKFQVDEKRRKVAQIETMIAEFERMAADLEREIKVEQDRAGIHDPGHFAYPTYAKAAIARRENLKRSSDELRTQLEDAKLAQFVGRTLEVLAPGDRSLGIGRIGEVAGIVDAGAILLDLDLALEIGGHALELGDHGLDLGDLAPFLVDLKLLQANKRLSGLHRLLLPRSHNRSHLAPRKPRAAP